MNEQLRIPLTIVAGCIYAGLILLKILQIRGIRLPASRREEQRDSLRFSLVRLIIDCAVMLGFLLSDLYPVWFGRFSNTPLGLCSGLVLLILATLILSVFVDGFRMRKQIRQTGGFGDFLLRQMVSILRILFVLVIVWGCFLIPDGMGADLPARIVIVAGLLLMIRVLLDLARRYGVGQERTKKPGNLFRKTKGTVGTNKTTKE